MTTVPVAGPPAADTILDVALRYLQEGIAVIPVPFRSKAPVIADWPNIVITVENAPEYFDGPSMNIGAKLGTPSGNLQDIDLDCAETMSLAPHYLPPTRTFGRATKPQSHWIYRAPDLGDQRTRKFSDPVTKKCMVELRSTGGQTIFPGSVHECGEPIEDDVPGAAVAAQPRVVLEQDVGKLAAAALLLRYSPGCLDEQDGTNALAAGLLSDGWPIDRVREFVTPIATAWEWGSSLSEDVTADPTAWGRLGDILSIDDKRRTKIVDKVREWLGLPALRRSATRNASRDEDSTELDGGGPEEEAPRLKAIAIEVRYTLARAWIANYQPAISGQSGHKRTFGAAIEVVRRFALGADLGLKLLLEGYNDRCQPPWSEAELRHKVDDAFTKDEVPWGSSLLRIEGTGTDQSDRRPVIIVAPDIHVVVKEAVEALREDVDLYVRAGKLVHVVPISFDEEEGGLKAGTPIIRDMPCEIVQLHLSQYARFLRLNKKSFQPCMPPEHVARTVCALGEWARLRPLLGIVEAPIMLRDGSILQTQGYHVATGLLYAPSCVFPSMPVAPTLNDAQAALARLAFPYVDFPFENEAQRLVPIANTMTILCRPAIVGHVPGFLYDAPMPGAGKSLITDAVSIQCSGRECPRSSYPVDHGATNDTEMVKLLTGYAAAGVGYFSFDNIPPTTPIGGGPLDKAMTARLVQFRQLGQSKRNETYRWISVVMGTVNNPSFSDDGAARRWLHGRIVPKEEAPD